LCSKSSSEPGGAWIVVGRVVKPHGVHGDVVAEVITDFPERLTDGVRFGLGEGDAPAGFFEAYRVRYHKGRWLLSVTGIRDRDTVEGWRGQYMFLPEQSLDQLPEGCYYEHQLVGFECRSLDDLPLGHVEGVDQGSVQTRLVVRRGQRQFLVPFVPQIVPSVDLERRVVILDPPPGLLDDDFVTA
jgi:16S rRNA processing protein RimM